MTPAADVVELAIGPLGGRAISLLVMLSALGAINGMVLTASRIYAVWVLTILPSPGSGVGIVARQAVAAITPQAFIAMLLIVLVGTEKGRFCSMPFCTRRYHGSPWKNFSAASNACRRDSPSIGAYACYRNRGTRAASHASGNAATI